MPRLYFTITACALLLGAQLAYGQSNRPAPAGAPASVAPASSGTQVALIDIGFIFRKHPGYVAKREALAEKGKQLTASETNLKKQLQKESEKLKEYQLGSLEFKQLEAELTQKASDFQVQGQLSRRELAEEEVKLYYETYVEVQKIIDRLAASYGIQLVLRYDREPMSATDPDSIRRGLMNPVVFQHGLDITDLVLKELPGPVVGRNVRPALK
jgi:Skp family chaperone for outer membrane proteins